MSSRAPLSVSLCVGRFGLKEDDLEYPVWSRTNALDPQLWLEERVGLNHDGLFQRPQTMRRGSALVARRGENSTRVQLTCEGRSRDHFQSTERAGSSASLSQKAASAREPPSRVCTCVRDFQCDHHTSWDVFLPPKTWRRAASSATAPCS